MKKLLLLFLTNKLYLYILLLTEGTAMLIICLPAEASTWCSGLPECWGYMATAECPTWWAGEQGHWCGLHSLWEVQFLLEVPVWHSQGQNGRWEHLKQKKNQAHGNYKVSYFVGGVSNICSIIVVLWQWRFVNGWITNIYWALPRCLILWWALSKRNLILFLHKSTMRLVVGEFSFYTWENKTAEVKPCPRPHGPNLGNRGYMLRLVCLQSAYS